MSQNVLQFNNITGNQNLEVARQILESCNYDLNAALNLYFAREANAENEAMDNGDDDIQVIEPVPEVMIEESPSTSDSNDSDVVRAPIAPVRGQLVATSFAEQYGNGNRRRRAPHPIFEQNNMEPSSSGLIQYRNTDEGPTSKRRRDLKDLFRPPHELISRCNWDNFLALGQQKNKWLLVNIQDSGEFSSQVLNRDVWSNDTVKALISANFLFTQMQYTDHDAKRISSYYNCREFPSVFIVDPRTGEFVQTVTTTDGIDMVNMLTDFMEKYPNFEARDAKITAEHKQLCRPDVEVDQPSNTKNGESSKSDTNADKEAKRMEKVVSLKTPEYPDNSENKNKLEIPSNTPWEEYLPHESRRASKINLALKMPDGSRRTISVPSNTQLLALFAFIKENGSDPNKHQFVLTFPKRIYNQEFADSSLQHLDIGNNELVHVEEI